MGRCDPASRRRSRTRRPHRVRHVRVRLRRLAVADPATGASWPSRAGDADVSSVTPVGSGAGLEHREIAHRVAVMLDLFFQYHLEAAAYEVLLVGVRVRWLAAAHAVEFGLGESVDDTAHRGHTGEPRVEHL